jgi:hypothetical protein
VLRAGGLVVPIEHDIHATRPLPPTALVTRVVAWLTEAFGRNGIPAIGPRLWGVLQEAGLRPLGMIGIQPHFGPGDRHDQLAGSLPPEDPRDAPDPRAAGTDRGAGRGLPGFAAGASVVAPGAASVHVLACCGGVVEPECAGEQGTLKKSRHHFPHFSSPIPNQSAHRITAIPVLHQMKPALQGSR